jgi:hypothetical protein
MPNFCLVPQVAEKFKQDILDGKIDPAKLSAMTSAERHAFFAQELGESNATPVNALFESKLLLKNQQAGMINWAKQVLGKNPVVQRDIIAKINRLDKVLSVAEEEAFLNELANQRLGINISYEEAGKIAELSKKIEETKTLIKEDSPIRSPERLEYGANVTELKNYTDELKLVDKQLTLKEKVADVVTHPIKSLAGLSGALKSVLASLDNSFFGRQGIKTLYTNPDIWAKNFAKSWLDFGKELKGQDAIAAIKADIYSRPNALNRKYQTGGFGLNVLTEEAYPSSLPEKMADIGKGNKVTNIVAKPIQILGRLFKASESAYNGGALRIRADLADRYIKLAEEQGINMLNKEEAQGIGNVISSLTGRGNLGLTESQSKTANALFFSVRFLKSNFDTLTLHQFDKNATSFAKKQAAKNLLKIIGTVASVLTIAKILDPESVEEDPRSKNFGKIKIGSRWVDITGGMGSIVSLASQVVPTRHDGKWGFWSKNAKTGTFTNLGVGYGVRSPLDVIEDFFEGKLSPLAGVFRDVLQRRTYKSEPVTLSGEAKQVTTPLIGQTTLDLLKDQSAANVIGFTILEGLGFSSGSANSETNWSNNPGVELQQLKEKIGNAEFKKANDQFNKEFNKRLKDLQSSAPQYQSKTEEEKAKAITKLKDEIKNKIFKQYNFKYKKK